MWERGWIVSGGRLGMVVHGSGCDDVCGNGCGGRTSWLLGGWMLVLGRGRMRMKRKGLRL